MYRQRESAKGNHKQPATGKNEVQRHFRRTIPTDREGGKKDKVLCDRLLLSARERAMDIIGYNYLKTMQNLHSENCLLAQHLSAKNLLANSADENFIRFWSLFPLNCITLRSSIFLLRREVVYHTTPYLSSHPPGQSELSVGNASAPHSYRSQAVCDFLWRIPSADTSLSERNSEMIGVYYQRLTHESLRIGSTNSINGSTFRTEMTGIILFFTGFRCRISYFS